MGIVNSEEKTCPRCAETVKAAALMCRYCNYEFEKSSSDLLLRTAPSSSAEGSRGPNKRLILYGWIAIVGVFAIILLSSLNTHPSGTAEPTSTTSPTDATSTEPEAMQVSATELAAAYSANEVAAQQTYGEKTLDITGTISGVTLDLFGEPVIQMVGVNQFLPVQAQFDKSYSNRLATISKGDQITVRCTSITEVVSAPMLSDCSFPD